MIRDIVFEEHYAKFARIIRDEAFDCGMDYGITTVLSVIPELIKKEIPVTVESIIEHMRTSIAGQKQFENDLAEVLTDVIMAIAEKTPEKTLEETPVVEKEASPTTVINLFQKPKRKKE